MEQRITTEDVRTNGGVYAGWLDEIESSDSPHHHTCKGCATVWKHDPRELIRRMAGVTRGELTSQLAAQSEYQRSHACPKCGKDERHISGARLGAEFCHNGKRTITKDGREIEPHAPLLDGDTAEELADLDRDGLVRRAEDDPAKRFIRALERMLGGMD